MDSKKGNIKEKYHFSTKLANGGFGVVYLAEHRQTKEKFAVKAIQKKKLKDYTTFINEINILKVLVSTATTSTVELTQDAFRTIQISFVCSKSGNGTKSAS